jgi:aryl-alcohol dehydrogenase-like predicted oxidoreductase
MRHQIEQTLDNLCTDHLDVYFLHNLNFGPKDAHLDGALGQLSEFRRQGLVRAVGLRGPHRFAPDRLRSAPGSREDKRKRFLRLVEAVRPEVVSARYHALTPEPDLGSADIFEFTARRRLGLLLYKPLAQGLLTGAHRPGALRRFGPGDHRARKRWFTPEAVEVLWRGLVPVRARFGERTADLVRVALRYCLQRADHAVVVVGFSRPEQVEVNLTCLGAPLTAEDLTFLRARLGEVRAELDALGTPFLDEATGEATA